MWMPNSLLRTTAGICAASFKVAVLRAGRARMPSFWSLSMRWLDVSGQILVPHQETARDARQCARERRTRAGWMPVAAEDRLSSCGGTSSGCAPSTTRTLPGSPVI
jgi:hypothetical protein